MKSKLPVSAVVLIAVLAPFGCAKREPKCARWADEQAWFSLKVTEGTATSPFVAELRIGNKTANALSFPRPFVMPLCGDTNGNNIRVYDRSGRQLEMRGIHADYYEERPVTEIPGHSSESWAFELDKSFRDMRNPGTYLVELWYFSDQHDRATWKGRVQMERLTVTREHAFENK